MTFYSSGFDEKCGRRIATLFRFPVKDIERHAFKSVYNTF